MKKSFIVILTAVALGALYQVGFTIRRDRLDRGIMALKTEDGTALQHLMPLARLGDTKAQELVGLAYGLGLGVPKDDRAAIYWFRRSGSGMESGHTDRAAAQSYELALHLRVLGDSAESRKWLRFAAKGGHRDAAAMLRK